MNFEAREGQIEKSKDGRETRLKTHLGPATQTESRRPGAGVTMVARQGHVCVLSGAMKNTKIVAVFMLADMLTYLTCSYQSKPPSGGWASSRVSKAQAC